MQQRPDWVFEAIWAQATKLFPAESFSVALCGPGPNQVTYELVVDRGVRQPRHTRDLGDGLSDLVMRTRQPILVRNFEIENGAVSLSWMGAPISAGGSILGLVSAECHRQGAFDQKDLAILGILANWAASAIESARACEQQKQDAESIADLLRAARHEGEAAAFRELSEMRSRLISTISHELRTPLSLIQAGSELLMQRLFEPEQLRQVAGLVNQGSMRLAEVVDDIIEFSDLQSGATSLLLAPANPLDVVRDAIEDAAGAAQSHRVLLEAVEPLPMSRLDGRRLKSVIAKLVRNALNFSKEPSAAVVRLSVAAGRLRVEISDSGFGIPPAEVDRIFEPFFRGETAQARCVPGTGLGLSISKQLVEAMGGEVAVHSEVDKGSTFVLSIPVEHR